MSSLAKDRAFMLGMLLLFLSPWLWMVYEGAKSIDKASRDCEATGGVYVKLGPPAA